MAETDQVAASFCGQRCAQVMALDQASEASPPKWFMALARRNSDMVNGPQTTRNEAPRTTGTEHRRHRLNREKPAWRRSMMKLTAALAALLLSGMMAVAQIHNGTSGVTVTPTPAPAPAPS